CSPRVAIDSETHGFKVGPGQPRDAQRFAEGEGHGLQDRKTRRRTAGPDRERHAQRAGSLRSCLRVSRAELVVVPVRRMREDRRVRVGGATRGWQEVFDRACAGRGQGWWSFPSGECAKIGAGDTRRDGETTVLALTPRPGEALSVAGVEECLRYVLADSIG